jgi:hypothetical protein
MRKRILLLMICYLLLISSCSTATPPATPEVVPVYSTAAAEPWLSSLYACAEGSTVLERVDDPAAAQIALRVGEPVNLSSFAYQIDTEEILIVTHRQSPVQNLNLEGVRTLFSGSGDPSMQVWVYASDADVQEVFDQLVMEGRVVSPSARIAANPQQMSDTLVNEANSVGILPRHWKVGDPREVFSAGTVPVLAITPDEPQGLVKQLLTCLQK